MRYLKNSLIVTGLVGGLLLSCGLAGTVSAAADDSTESITLTPVSKHYTLDAGSTTNDTLTIINSGSKGYDFIVYARPYAIIDSNYQDPNYGDKANSVANADAYKWAAFKQSTYHLNPGQSVDVPYTLNVPANAAPGGHYGVIFAETQANANGANIARNKRVGMVLYATVKGAYKTGASIEGPTIPFFQIEPPLSAGASVQNTGNAGLVTTVSYRVMDIFGNQKYAEQKDYDVLPDTTRAINLRWTTAPSFGLFKAEVHVSALGQVSDKTGYVFMAPFWFYGIVAIIVVGGIMYAMARRRG